MAIRNILGFFPTYMRPPKGTCTKDSGCLDKTQELNLHVVTWDLDTKDFVNNTPDTIGKSKEIFDQGLTTKNIVLSHDIQEQTVLVLAEYMLKKAEEAGLKTSTVGGCLGDPEENWYIQAPASKFCILHSEILPSENFSANWRAGDECSVPEGQDDGNEGRDENDGDSDADLEPSKDGTCGERSDGKYTCKDSDYGDCCSYNGFW